MDDRERLWAALKRLSDAVPVEVATLIDEVSALAEAARAAERDRIVAWLRRRQFADPFTQRQVSDRLAACIERGDHEARP